MEISTSLNKFNNTLDICTVCELSLRRPDKVKDSTKNVSRALDECMEVEYNLYLYKMRSPTFQILLKQALPAESTLSHCIAPHIKHMLWSIELREHVAPHQSSLDLELSMNK